MHTLPATTSTRRRADPFARFLYRVVFIRNGCWEWIGGKVRGGYGTMWLDGERINPHRYSYMLYRGDITEGMFVCHTCDNPSCVNPSHLFLGTAADNNRDSAAKGRKSSGESRYNAKLTWEAVDEIRAYLAAGATQADCSREYGVSKSAIGWIASGKHWQEKDRPRV